MMKSDIDERVEEVYEDLFTRKFCAAGSDCGICKHGRRCQDGTY